MRSLFVDCNIFADGQVSLTKEYKELSWLGAVKEFKAPPNGTSQKHASPKSLNAVVASHHDYKTTDNFQRDLTPPSSRHPPSDHHNQCPHDFSSTAPDGDIRQRRDELTRRSQQQQQQQQPAQIRTRCQSPYEIRSRRASSVLDLPCKFEKEERGRGRGE